MNKEILILRAQRDYGWSKAFATEYIMEKIYSNLSHHSAFKNAMRSPFISESDKPQMKDGKYDR